MKTSRTNASSPPPTATACEALASSREPGPRAESSRDGPPERPARALVPSPHRLASSIAGAWLRVRGGRLRDPGPSASARPPEPRPEEHDGWVLVSHAPGTPEALRAKRAERQREVSRALAALPSRAARGARETEIDRLIHSVLFERGRLERGRAHDLVRRVEREHASATGAVAEAMSAALARVRGLLSDDLWSELDRAGARSHQVEIDLARAIGARTVSIATAGRVEDLPPGRPDEPPSTRVGRLEAWLRASLTPKARGLGPSTREALVGVALMSAAQTFDAGLFESFWEEMAAASRPRLVAQGRDRLATLRFRVDEREVVLDRRVPIDVLDPETLAVELRLLGRREVKIPIAERPVIHERYTFELDR